MKNRFYRNLKPMLRHLTIQNFALIEHYEISFDKGMSVLTGETGAGKSILIDALGLALGARADSKWIRKDTMRCDISAEFDIQRLTNAQNWLQQHSLDNEELCILRRTITNDGKSRAFINGQSVTAQQLMELGELLVNIHGQHDHQFLTKREHQRILIDEFSQNQTLLTEIKTIHDAWQQLEQEKQSLSQESNSQAHRDFLHFQYEELEALQLMPDTFEKLEAEYKTLNQASHIQERLETALHLLEEDEVNFQTLFKTLLTQLTPIAAHHSNIENALKNIESAKISLEEAACDLRQFHDQFDLSPEHLEKVASQLDSLHRIARKHKVHPEALCDLSATLKAEIDKLAHKEENIAKLEKAQAQLQNQYDTLSQKLSKKRQTAAQKLSKLITQEMQTLAMTGGAFEIRLQHLEGLHPYGQERCEFWVKSNPGQDFQALAKVASGGELSRIGLAIQVILAAHSIVPTLIFDEVDVGIGGATASVVGKLLKQVAQHVQVLCVTHLPQVAAFGHHHYQVEKQVILEKTHTALKKLSTQDREKEVARMLGGLTLTEQGLAHAKDLLEQAK